MKNLVRLLAVFGGAFAACAHAHEPAVSRYRVHEIQPPASLQSGCEPGYARTASIATINDLGVVNGSFTCYTNVVVDPLSFQYQSGTLVAGPWFDAIALPTSTPAQAFTYSINNRGELFGYEGGPAETGGLFATRWSLAGGRERIFFDPACENIQFQAAVDGNARYTVGWGLRGDPSLPPPIDQLCISTRWLIRDAAGMETSGPLYGSPSSMNTFSVAVGTSSRSAVRYHVPSGELRVLHAADATHSAEATHINDLGEVAGRVTRNTDPLQNPQCVPGVAVRWDRDGRERALPHLPGAVASRAYAVGYDGETVGDSGAGEQYCSFTDNATERAVLWKGARAYDLNSLIPRSTRITLTYAYSVNRRGQITAGGYENDEPLAQCATSVIDPDTGGQVVVWAPCHNQRMYVLTPVGR